MLAPLTVAELDLMAPGAAAELLFSCCGSRKWVDAMVTRRPFHTLSVLLTAADNFWLSLAPADWQEAFASHPRIGERRARAATSGRAQAWSAGEQSGMNLADETVRTSLADINGEYERRFGYTCIVCATGKSAEEMLEQARARLANDPETELATAAKEQEQIMRLRLEKLFR